MNTMEMTVPDRSLRQRLDALAGANDIRTRRARLKRNIKAGRVCAVGVLVESPDWVGTMRVMDLMLAVPKVGRVKANRALVVARVSPSKTVGGLTERQRGELADWLRGWSRG